VEYRQYGKQEDLLSIIAFAGIVLKDESVEDSNKYVSWAIEHGVNYFDVAPGYGNAQNMLGPALHPFRHNVFLACKTKHRTGVESRADLENSLKVLQTDYFDLYQLHAMTTEEDFKLATGPGGALDAILKAKEEGIIRHIGFSAHSAEVAVKLMRIFDFDSILFPVNFTTWFEAGFGPKIMDEAEKLNVSRLALKSAAHYKLKPGQDRPRQKCWYAPIEDRELLKLALRWALSQPITSAIPPGDPELWRMAVEVAHKFTPITTDEEKSLKTAANDRTPLFELAHG
tara:strand:- start:116 stop:970 length:855 start_codon:yes stop_codon:yes gene_type:complete